MIINFKKCIFQVVTSVLSVFTNWNLTASKMNPGWAECVYKDLDGKNSDIDK